MRRSGQIYMMDGPPAKEPEPGNNGDPYDKAVPILAQNGSDTIRTALSRPRVTAAVFKHESTEQVSCTNADIMGSRS